MQTKLFGGISAKIGNNPESDCITCMYWQLIDLHVLHVGLRSGVSLARVSLATIVAVACLMAVAFHLSVSLNSLAT